MHINLKTISPATCRHHRNDNIKVREDFKTKRGNPFVKSSIGNEKRSSRGNGLEGKEPERRECTVKDETKPEKM